MRILLDACVPRPLRGFLDPHIVYTAQEMGWGDFKNGTLLSKAESDFDLFISADQNLKFQQNISRMKLSILVLPTNDWPVIRSKALEIAAAVESLKPGDFLSLDWN